jgi:hypothetical protein
LLRPSDELVIRYYLKRLTDDTSGYFRILECDIYRIFLEILEGKRVLNAVAAQEEKKGFRPFWK